MLRINTLITLLFFLASHAYADDLACNDIDKITSTGKVMYEKDNIPFYTSPPNLSRLVIYKEYITPKNKNEYAVTPILFAGKNKYYLDFNWYKERDNSEVFPKFVSIYTEDFNQDGLNELVIITEDEGWLREFNSAGYVRSALVAADQDTLNKSDSCIIHPYPYINEHLDTIRSAHTDGKDKCIEGFCNVAQIKRELKRLQQLTPAKFLTEAHKMAMAAYRNNFKDTAANISNAAFLYKNSLSGDTVAVLNDMGFFKEEAKEYDKALLILEPIAEKYPNRTVVFLNLGDAYTGLNQTDKAVTAYQQYVNLMKKSGKERRIPKRVFNALQ